MRARLALLLGVLAGCNGSPPAEEPWPAVEWRWHQTRDVDLLLMIDNSNDMFVEHALLAEQFPYLVEVLATGDLDEDGAPDQPVPASVHVGVVFSDMGTGGYEVPTCTLQPFGLDGLLNTRGNTYIAGCVESYPAVVAFGPGPVSPDRLIQLSCLAQPEHGGCGFAQSLEAILKAVTPATSPIRFQRETTGHGDGANAGFLRDGSLLAVVLLTDEDDASAADTDVLNPESTTYPGDLNVRFIDYPEAFHPPSRFARGLLALRDPFPDRLLYAAITGTPVLALPGGDLAGVEAILADPLMQVRLDTSAPRPVPSCRVPERGNAFPPRRIVETAREIALGGGRVAIQTICTQDYEAQVQSILGAIGTALRPRCLDAAPEPGRSGTVACDLSIDGAPLPQLAVDAAGAPELGEGWWWDATSGDAARWCPATGQVAFTPGVAPAEGAVVRLACRPGA